MTALAAAWALLRTPQGLTVAAILAALAALHLWGRAREEAGRVEERARIERQDRGAMDATLDAFRDVRACADAGGLWSHADGRCRRRLPPLGP